METVVTLFGLDHLRGVYRHVASVFLYHTSSSSSRVKNVYQHHHSTRWSSEYRMFPPASRLLSVSVIRPGSVFRLFVMSQILLIGPASRNLITDEKTFVWR